MAMALQKHGMNIIVGKVGLSSKVAAVVYGIGRHCLRRLRGELGGGLATSATLSQILSFRKAAHARV